MMNFGKFLPLLRKTQLGFIFLMSINLNRNSQEIQSEELEQAIDICLKYRKSWQRRIATFGNVIMPEIIKVFGEKKANLIIEKIFEYENIYHSYKLPSHIRVSVGEEDELAREEFLKSYPNAPQRLIRAFGDCFCFQRR